MVLAGFLQITIHARILQAVVCSKRTEMKIPFQKTVEIVIDYNYSYVFTYLKVFGIMVY